MPRTRALLVVLFGLLGAMALHAQSKGGRWTMEGNGDDSADWDGRPDNGLLQGEAAFAQPPGVPEGKGCLWLDSTYVHDYFRIGDSPDLDFENENVGISMWIYPTVLNDVHFLVNKGTQSDAAKATCYALRISLAKKIEFLIRDSNNKAQTAASGFTVPLDQWTFVAAWYDFNAGKVYFWNRPEAAPVDSAGFRFNYLANDGPLSIGSWYRDDPAAPSIKDFQGGIDDVRISGRREDLIPRGTRVVRHNPAATLPGQLQLYPNPLSLTHHDGLTISGLAPWAGRGTLMLFNLRGQLIGRQEIERLPFRWTLQDARSGALPAGCYLLQLRTGAGLISHRLTLIR
ncbi:MAG TPA: hypothetical protein PKI62_12750 [bacterium]|nr:hypothetical protein [bacterium]HPR88311.1 hypothetical protein [bacterium]